MTRYHLIGIGGAGMSAIARLLLARGTVSGSDQGRWPLSDALVGLGATVHDTFDAAFVTGADVAIRSSAYGDTNVEVRAAREHGIPVWKREDAWRLLAEGRRVVAVAGTHGKTTTTAMTYYALGGGGIDASLVCGAAVTPLGANAHAGSSDVLVIEADEYDRAFHALAPAVAVVLNVDHDHVDVFPTREDYAQAFRVFAAGIAHGGTLVACADDPGALALARAVRASPAGRAVVTYGTSEEADLRVRPLGDGGIELARGDERASAMLHPRGVHNARNAAAAAAAAGALGVSLAHAAMGLLAFQGTGRRLEELGGAGGVRVVDDYAHHPAEILASLEAVRGEAGRVVAVFQPHTPSRLRAFFDGFAMALRSADVAVVVETFPSARERPEPGATRALADAAGARYARDPLEAAAALASIVRPGDLVLVLGAGDIRAAGERLLELLRDGAATTSRAEPPRVRSAE